MKFRLFQDKTPTAAEVSQQIATAEQERTALEQRNREIDGDLAALYGVDSPETAELENEHRANADKIRRIGLALTGLHQERKAAHLREASALYRTARQDIIADVAALNAVKPKADAAKQKWAELAQQEQQLRQKANHAQLTSKEFYTRHVAPLGISQDEWSGIAQLVNAETPAADTWVAANRRDADALSGSLKAVQQETP
jgi:hypothetical protein